MKTNTSDDYKNFPKSGLPGDHVANNLSGVSPYDLTLLNFDHANVETHQTETTQSPDAQLSSFADNRIEAMLETARRTVNIELEALRNQNPFMQIVPMPMKTIFVVASKANDVRDVNLPDGTQMIRFTGSQDFFVSVNGQLQMPLNEDLTGANGIMYNPRDQWYYVANMKNLSVGLPANMSGVSIQCYVQL